MNRHLAVLLYGQHVADLEQTQGGQHLLHYREDPGTTPISLSMPLTGGTFRQQVVDPFLEGLLPEREAAREAMSRELDVSARNPFALLSTMGLDCAGAVQLCADDEVPDVLAQDGNPEVGALRARMLDPVARSCADVQSQRTRGDAAPGPFTTEKAGAEPASPSHAGPADH